MKDGLTGKNRRWKNRADADGGVLVTLFLGLTFILLSHGVYAQTVGKPITPQSPSLPRPFAQFSTTDVLKQIFANYNPATGRVSGILNEERKPAVVQIEEVGLWRVQGQDHLVVLISISEEQDPTPLCGNCLMNAFLAVLKKNGPGLSLVAKQLTLPSSGAPVDFESLNQGELITVTGHDNVSLDLAPYKLNSRETLIGFRLEHIWLPTSDWSTSLLLYRIEGERLREVFREPVVEREYPADSGRSGRTVEKTTSTLSLSPAGGSTNQMFNDLVINKTTARCFNKDSDEDCNSKHEGFKEIKTKTELWQFDGKRYVQAAPSKP